ncbi:uncharacterized protein PHACADRAFT_265755 [Phanerochaete carnosa HHB-10118-sp]|uniref:F-box domain-containing protein n=1 Tax=Phanerochaete carnosa (strain HHB-10118-sp) TaxID=650164 RepID=K5VRI7_PHACS|nr:uncharacterized protein PHACADRAFT_265755 [Phanerochaete carnosa HHB-10118-sp]EKM49199.1 hypothetical protein PHACADRAFT_265755 [Phanerochaete carnosa HHB-10118-sp]
MSSQKPAVLLRHRRREHTLPAELLVYTVFGDVFHLDKISGQRKQPFFAWSLVCRSWREQTFRYRFWLFSLYVCPEGVESRETDLTIQNSMYLDLFGHAQEVVRSLMLYCGAHGQPTDIELNFPSFALLFPQLQALDIHRTLLTRGKRSELYYSIHPGSHKTRLRGQLGEEVASEQPVRTVRRPPPV